VASGLIDSYRFHSATIGATVRVELPGGDELVDVASGVDDDGALVVGGRRVAAGDVVHVSAT
jgi:BirA family biotin operon repressor/biotin-[acetyl-CoA-carboxylase] ligase